MKKCKEMLTCLVLLGLCIVSGFRMTPSIRRLPQRSQPTPMPVLQAVSKVNHYKSHLSEAGLSEEAKAKRKESLEALDALTAPLDKDDPDYDYSKVLLRNELVECVSHFDLKCELKARGMDYSGSKLEMMVRILLAEIDPSIVIDFNPRVERVEFFNQSRHDEHMANAKTRPLTLEEKLRLSEVPRTMAEDHIAKERLGNKGPELRLTDSMRRRVVTCPPARVLRSHQDSKHIDRDLQAYAVSANEVMANWKQSKSAVILLPCKDKNWKSKEMRVIADQLAYRIQSVVLVPNIYRYKSDAINTEEAAYKQVFDDVVAWLQFAEVEMYSKAMSLAGVGTGADMALRIAADMHSLSCLHLVNHIKQAAVSEEEVVPIVSKANVFRRPTAYVSAAFEEDEEEGEGANAEEEARKEAAVMEMLGVGNNSEHSAADKQMYQQELKKMLKEMNAEDTGSADDITEAPDKEFFGGNRPSEEEVIAAAYAADWKRIQEEAQTTHTQGLMDGYPTISLEEVCALKPKVVLALTPELQSVGHLLQRLSTPFRIVVAGKQRLARHNARKLADALNRRRGELLDYSFQFYPGRHANFVYNFTQDLDEECSEQVLTRGAAWLGTMTMPDDRPMMTNVGLGLGLDIEGLPMNNAVQTIDVEALRDKDIERRRMVAEFLHDETDFSAVDGLHSVADLSVLYDDNVK